MSFPFWTLTLNN